MKAMLRRLRESIFYVVLSLAAAFIVVIVVIIRETPPSGAGSTVGLVGLVQHAVDTGSRADLASAFEDPASAEDLSSTYLGRLSDQRIVSLVVSYRTAPVAGVLVTGKAASGQQVCTLWAVNRTDGRWYLDIAPTLAPASC